MAERDREDEIEKGNSMAGGEEVGDYKMRGGDGEGGGGIRVKYTTVKGRWENIPSDLDKMLPSSCIRAREAAG